MTARTSINDLTSDQLDALHARLEHHELYMRAVNRADALADEWDDDPTPITRAEAAELLSRVLQLTGWEQVDAPLGPPLHLVSADVDTKPGTKIGCATSQARPDPANVARQLAPTGAPAHDCDRQEAP